MGETLSGAAAQSLFGGAANTVMTKITAVCAGLFMLTCLSLAALSTARGRSVIDQLRKTSGQLPFTLPQEQEFPSTPETPQTDEAAPTTPVPSETTLPASSDEPPHESSTHQ